MPRHMCLLWEMGVWGDRKTGKSGNSLVLQFEQFVINLDDQHPPLLA